MGTCEVGSVGAVVLAVNVGVPAVIVLDDGLGGGVPDPEPDLLHWAVDHVVAVLKVLGAVVVEQRDGRRGLRVQLLVEALSLELLVRLCLGLSRNRSRLGLLDPLEPLGLVPLEALGLPALGLLLV